MKLTNVVAEWMSRGGEEVLHAFFSHLFTVLVEVEACCFHFFLTFLQATGRPLPDETIWKSCACPSHGNSKPSLILGMVVRKHEGSTGEVSEE